MLELDTFPNSFSVETKLSPLPVWTVEKLGCLLWCKLIKTVPYKDHSVAEWIANIWIYDISYTF